LQRKIKNLQISPYIWRLFIITPIYDNNKKIIGYKATNDYIQEVGTNQYLVRYLKTYLSTEKDRYHGNMIL
jgi:hypothetical protein